MNKKSEISAGRRGSIFRIQLFYRISGLTQLRTAVRHALSQLRTEIRHTLSPANNVDKAYPIPS